MLPDTQHFQVPTFTPLPLLKPLGRAPKVFDFVIASFFYSILIANATWNQYQEPTVRTQRPAKAEKIPRTPRTPGPPRTPRAPGPPRTPRTPGASRTPFSDPNFPNYSSSKTRNASMGKFFLNEFVTLSMFSRQEAIWEAVLCHLLDMGEFDSQ